MLKIVVPESVSEYLSTNHSMEHGTTMAMLMVIQDPGHVPGGWVCVAITFTKLGINQPWLPRYTLWSATQQKFPCPPLAPEKFGLAS